MKNTSNLTSVRSAKKLIGGIMLTVFAVLAISGPVHADDRDSDRDHGRDWHGHEVYAHRHWGEHRPGYVYAPPVVYAPPPQYESPGINLILPLHIH